MARVLKDLLTSNEPLFVFALSQLERSTGGAGVDVKLIGDITHKAHDIMRTLSLDPADTTSRELYLALNAYVSRTKDYTIFLDADYVLLRVEDEIISFNIIDIIENIHHELGFEARTVSHGQRALRGEIADRYLNHPRTHEGTTSQLLLDAGISVEDHVPNDKPLLALFDETAQAKNDTKKTQGESMDNDAPHILAIGDIFTDAFIKLDEKYAFVEKDESGKEWLKLPFGSKPPYEQVDIVRSVGPSPNAAVSFARLGLNSSLMAWVGGDDVGREAIQHLESENISTSSMVVEQDKATSYWYVLRHGSDRTMLVKSEKYQYVWQDPERVPDWIYLAYIGADSWPLHEGLLAYLEAHPEVKFVFQPATYHFEWGPEKLAGFYKRAYMTVMNREEAEQVTGQSHDDLRGLANGLHELGSEVVVITDGAHGSYASHDGHLVTIPNYPDPAPPTDRTGAGDAFASTITAALALGKSMDEALTWAPINSASVVQKIGAQAGLLHRDELFDWLGKAPEEYKVTDLEG